MSTVARGALSYPFSLALCSDAKSGKQQLVVADYDNHRLIGVDLRTGTSVERSRTLSVMIIDFCSLRQFVGCCAQVLRTYLLVRGTKVTPTKALRSVYYAIRLL